MILFDIAPARSDQAAESDLGPMRLVFTKLFLCAPHRHSSYMNWMEPFINELTKVKRAVTEPGGADGFRSTICDLLNPPSSY